MQVKAISKYNGKSAKKTQIPVDIVRGMKVADALNTLKYMPKSAALEVMKAIKSAAANAYNNHSLNVDSLYVYRIAVGQGPSSKRIVYKGKGGYAFITRPTSHITVVLSDTMTEEVETVKVKKSAKAESKQEVISEAEVVEKPKKATAKKVTTNKTGAKKSSTKKA